MPLQQWKSWKSKQGQDIHGSGQSMHGYIIFWPSLGFNPTPLAEPAMRVLWELAACFLICSWTGGCISVIFVKTEHFDAIFWKKKPDDRAWQYWRSVIGYSDDGGGEDVEGFILHEIVKGDESDIDLDIVVQSRRWNCQSGCWPHSTSRCHCIRILLFSVARYILDCGTDKCVCWTNAVEQRAWQDLKGDYSFWNEIIHFHSVYVWDPSNAKNGHVLVHWSPSSGFCHRWCDEQRLISKAEPVLPSEWQLGCCCQRATWIRPFVESLPSAWCYHCQQPCPLLPWQQYFHRWGSD